VEKGVTVDYMGSKECMRHEEWHDLMEIMAHRPDRGQCFQLAAIFRPHNFEVVEKYLLRCKERKNEKVQNS
jgi:hypothetical protein